MGRLLPLLMLVCLTASTMRGAFEERAHGARLIALGGASSGISGEIWAIPANPAIAGTIRERTLSVSTTPELFGLEELSSVDLVFVQPFKPGSLAVTGSVFGSDLYRETGASLSAGWPLSRKFEVGLSLTVYSLNIRNYGSAWTLGVTAGVLVHLSEILSLGLAADNLNGPAIGAVREPLPQTMHAGLSYQPQPCFLIAADVTKDLQFPAGFSMGFEYAPIEALLLRGGTTLNPSTYSAGIGVRTAIVRLDYAFSAHPDLGLSHSFSISLVLEGW
jgi:hypothetical protein